MVNALKVSTIKPYSVPQKCNPLTAPLSKNAASAFQKKMQTTFFYLERFLKNLADDQCSSITIKTVSTISNIIHTTFYHGSGLAKNLMFNGSIYNVLYLHILRFYVVRRAAKLTIIELQRLSTYA